jgi:hypothetical protein
MNTVPVLCRRIFEKFKNGFWTVTTGLSRRDVDVGCCKGVVACEALSWDIINDCCIDSWFKDF